MNHTDETASIMATKLTPPVAVIGANIGGISLPEWVTILTIVYLVLMVLHLLWKWQREWKTGKVARDDTGD